MSDPSEPTSVRVYEAATEAAAMELLSSDVPKMSLHGWIVSSRRWSDPAPPAETPTRRHAALVVAGLGVVAALLAAGWAMLPPFVLLPFALVSAGTIGVTAAILARREGRRREPGTLWVVWRQAPVRAEPQHGVRKLNPGGYCRMCGASREVGATLCNKCGTGVSPPRSGTFG